MKLEAARAKGKYKSTEHWLDAIYRKNKDFIDSKLNITNPKASKKTVFKNLVKEYIEEGYTPKKAVDILSRTTIFTPEVERFQINAIEGIREDKQVWKRFRKLAGWKTKIDPTKLVYDKSQGIYIYDGRLTIDFRNSPRQIIVAPIST